MEEHENQYPVGFYFSISFDGSEQGFFQEVSGISNEMSLEDIVGGGESSKYRIPIKRVKRELVLKRGTFPKDSSFFNWCVDTLEGDFSTPIQTKNISVSLLDNEGKVSMEWRFYKVYPIKYSVSSLGSQQNEILIESLELAYTYFDRKQS